MRNESQIEKLKDKIELVTNNTDSSKLNEEIKGIKMRLSNAEESSNDVHKDIINKLKDLDTKTNDIQNNSDQMELNLKKNFEKFNNNMKSNRTDEKD